MLEVDSSQVLECEHKNGVSRVTNAHNVTKRWKRLYNKRTLAKLVSRNKRKRMKRWLHPFSILLLRLKFIQYVAV